VLRRPGCPGGLGCSGRNVALDGDPVSPFAGAQAGGYPRRAQKYDLIGRNVAELVDLPQGQPGHPSRAMTEEQVTRVLKAASGQTTGFIKVVKVSQGRYAATHAATETTETTETVYRHVIVPAIRGGATVMDSGGVRPGRDRAGSAGGERSGRRTCCGLPALSVHLEIIFQIGDFRRMRR
jgi:hypothetical protein